MSDDVKFVDAEAYRGNADEKLTFKMIVLEYLRKIGGYSAVEFRGGYWETRTIPGSGYDQTIKTYIPDTREVYSNAVEYLYDVLYPHFDAQMRKEGEAIEKQMEGAFLDNTYLKTPDKEEDDETDAPSGKNRYFKDSDDRLAYRSVRRDLNRKLLRCLSCFLHRVKYMEGRTFSEEI